jgi:predicted metal-dependent hydrolase
VTQLSFDDHEERDESGAIADSDPPDPLPPLEVVVVRSARRRSTVGAVVRDGVLRVTVPSWMSAADEARWVAEMSRRFERSRATARIDLAARARTLSQRHGLSSPASIRWVDDMTTRWGSCTPATRSIRLSSRLAAFPDWVVDYVIVHELAHLDEPRHDERFWSLVRRYPRTERAIGYLIAKSGEVD